MNSATNSLRESSGRKGISLASSLTIAALMLQFFVPAAASAIVWDPEPTGSLTICKYSDNGVIGVYEDGIDTPLEWDMDMEALTGDEEGEEWDVETDEENGCVTYELPYGDYQITEEEEDGWTGTFPADSNSQTVSLGDDDETVIFLNKEAPPCISGFISIPNGGFETPEVVNKAKWDIFPSPVDGWIVEWFGGFTPFGGLDRPETANLELHRGVLGPAFEGEQYTELDTDWFGPASSQSNEPASVKIYQDIDTVPGADYELSFAFAPRPGRTADDNKLEVKWNGDVVDTIIMDGGGSIVWHPYTYSVTASDFTTRIEFTDVGTPNSYGPFLDDIRLERLCVTLKVIKKVEGSSQHANEFTMHVAGNNVSDSYFPGDEGGTEVTMEDGDFSVSEIMPQGSDYDFSLAGDCSGTAEVGESYTCTITNTFIPPPTTGSLTICKYRDTGVFGQYENGIDTPLAWDMTVTYPDQSTSSVATSGETGCVTINDLEFGVYSVTEASQDGWTRTYPAESDTQTATIECRISPTVIFLNFPQADIELTKSVDSASVENGHNATFTLNVTNLGPADATNVVVTDVLPAGLTFVSAEASLGTYDENTNEWTIDSLAFNEVAETVTLTIVVTIEGQDGQQIVNEACVSLDPDIDVNTDNDCASASITVTVPGQGGGPTPPPEPVVTSGGGGGNGPITQSNAYENWLQQNAGSQPPAGEVAGATPPPQGEVKGESTFLPATGFDMTEGLALFASLLALVGLAIIAKKKPEILGLN